MDELRGHREKTGIYCFINKGMLASAGHDFTFDPGEKRPQIGGLCVSDRQQRWLKSVCVLMFLNQTFRIKVRQKSLQVFTVLLCLDGIRFMHSRCISSKIVQHRRAMSVKLLLRRVCRCRNKPFINMLSLCLYASENVVILFVVLLRGNLHTWRRYNHPWLMPSSGENPEDSLIFSTKL